MCETCQSVTEALSGLLRGQKCRCSDVDLPGGGPKPRCCWPLICSDTLVNTLRSVRPEAMRTQTLHVSKYSEKRQISTNAETTSYSGSDRPLKARAPPSPREPAEGNLEPGQAGALSLFPCYSLFSHFSVISLRGRKQYAQGA